MEAVALSIRLANGTVVSKTTLMALMTENTPTENKTYLFAGAAVYYEAVGYDGEAAFEGHRKKAFVPGQTYRLDDINAYYPAATLESVDPDTAIDVSLADITITGTNLSGAVSGTIDGGALTDFVVVDDTTITATLPDLDGSSGLVDLVIADDAGSVTLTDAMTITDTNATVTPPLVPATGAAAGGTAVVITGTYLTGATGVTFGGTAGTAFSVVNATTIHVTTPAKSAGAYNVVIAHPRGNLTVTNGFTYA
jgi:hypothetical protein